MIAAKEQQILASELKEDLSQRRIARSSNTAPPTTSLLVHRKILSNNISCNLINHISILSLWNSRIKIIFIIIEHSRYPLKIKITITVAESSILGKINRKHSKSKLSHLVKLLREGLMCLFPVQTRIIGILEMKLVFFYSTSKAAVKLLALLIHNLDQK